MYEAIHPNLQLASISGGTDIMGCFVLGCPVLPVYAGEIQVRGLGMDVAILDDDGQKISGQSQWARRSALASSARADGPGQ